MRNTNSQAMSLATNERLKGPHCSEGNRTTYLNMYSIPQNGPDMRSSTAEKRLDRLAKSRVHFCEDASTHAKDLRELAKKFAKPVVAERQSRMFKALADETRMRILSLLRVREMCVCEIMIALELTQPTASHHLRILEGAGLVEDLRKGKWVFYKTADPAFAKRILEYPYDKRK